MPSVALEQPLGLTLEIMRLRSFARAWLDRNRKRGDDERASTGGIYEWVSKVEMKFDEIGIEEMRNVMATIPRVQG